MPSECNIYLVVITFLFEFRVLNCAPLGDATMYPCCSELHIFVIHATNIITPDIYLLDTLSCTWNVSVLYLFQQLYLLFLKFTCPSIEVGVSNNLLMQPDQIMEFWNFKGATWEQIWHKYLFMCHLNKFR